FLWSIASEIDEDEATVVVRSAGRPETLRSAMARRSPSALPEGDDRASRAGRRREVRDQRRRDESRGPRAGRTDRALAEGRPPHEAPDESGGPRARPRARREGREEAHREARAHGSYKLLRRKAAAPIELQAGAELRRQADGTVEPRSLGCEG